MHSQARMQEWRWAHHNSLSASSIFSSQNFLCWKHFCILNMSGFPLLSFWAHSFSYTTMDFGKNSCISVAHSMKIQLLPTSNSEHSSCWLHLMLLSPLPPAGSARKTAPTISSYNRHTLTDICQTEGRYFTKAFLPQKPICITDDSYWPPVKLPVQLHPFRHKGIRTADSA